MTMKYNVGSWIESWVRKGKGKKKWSRRDLNKDCQIVDTQVVNYSISLIKH